MGFLLFFFFPVTEKRERESNYFCLFRRERVKGIISVLFYFSSLFLYDSGRQLSLSVIERVVGSEANLVSFYFVFIQENQNGSKGNLLVVRVDLLKGWMRVATRRLTTRGKEILFYFSDFI